MARHLRDAGNNVPLACIDFQRRFPPLSFDASSRSRETVYANWTVLKFRYANTHEYSSNLVWELSRARVRAGISPGIEIIYIFTNQLRNTRLSRAMF